MLAKRFPSWPILVVCCLLSVLAATSEGVKDFRPSMEDDYPPFWMSQ